MSTVISPLDRVMLYHSSVCRFNPRNPTSNALNALCTLARLTESAVVGRIAGCTENGIVVGPLPGVGEGQGATVCAGEVATSVAKGFALPANSSGPPHQDSGEAKIRESTAGVSRKPSSDGKARGCSSKHLCGLTAWNT